MCICAQCVYEARVARLMKVRHLTISGEPVHLLMGDKKKRLADKEEEARLKKDDAEQKAKHCLEDGLNHPELLEEVRALVE